MLETFGLILNVVFIEYNSIPLKKKKKKNYLILVQIFTYFHQK